MKYWLAGIILVAAGIVAGCGSVETRFTVEQLTNARVAVEAAENADAKHLAPESLRRAQDALAIAGDAYTSREFDRAFAFAKQATIYARVAKSESEEKRAEDNFKTAKAQLEELQKQTQAEMAAQPGGPESVTPVARPLPAGIPVPVSPASREGASR